MTRRALLLSSTLLVRRQRHCERAGALAERNGLTEREARRMARRGCKQENGGWYTTLVVEG